MLLIWFTSALTINSNISPLPAGNKYLKSWGFSLKSRIVQFSRKCFPLWRETSRDDHDQALSVPRFASLNTYSEFVATNFPKKYILRFTYLTVDGRPLLVKFWPWQILQMIDSASTSLNTRCQLIFHVFCSDLTANFSAYCGAWSLFFCRFTTSGWLKQKLHRIFFLPLLPTLSKYGSMLIFERFLLSLPHSGDFYRKRQISPWSVTKIAQVQ